jgi:hypothetical protein
MRNKFLAPKLNKILFETETRKAGDALYPIYNVGGKKVAFEGATQFIPGSILGVDVIKATPESLLNTALKINPNSKANRLMLKNITTGNIGNNERRFLDKINAATGITNSGKLSRTERTEGYAEILSYLSGGKGAKKLVNNKLRIADKLMNEASGSANKKVGDMTIDPNIEDVVAIRSFNDYPISRNLAGEIEAFPAGNYATTPVPRATLHVTLEDVVQSHMQGQWSASNMKVVSGFNDILRRNPTSSLDNIRGNDTWFTPQAGDPLVFPQNSSIIRPFTNKDEYVQELIRRGLYDETKITPVMVSDPATKEVLHISKPRYNAAEMAQIAKLRGIPLNGDMGVIKTIKDMKNNASSWGSPIPGSRSNSFYRTKEEDANLNIASFFNRLLDQSAIQQAKSLIGKDTPFSPVGDNIGNARIERVLGDFSKREGITYSGTHDGSPQFNFEKESLIASREKNATKLGVRNKLKAYPFLREEMRMSALKGATVTRGLNLKNTAARKAEELEERELRGLMPSAQAATGGLIKNGKVMPSYFASGGYVMPKSGNFSKPKFHKGGMVLPKYGVGGEVDATLQTGEIVMSRRAVQNIGAEKLLAMNASASNSNPVYNSYSISVNANTNANPQEIARVVMNQINSVGDQRIRGNSF